MCIRDRDPAATPPKKTMVMLAALPKLRHNSIAKRPPWCFIDCEQGSENALPVLNIPQYSQFHSKATPMFCSLYHKFLEIILPVLNIPPLMLAVVLNVRFITAKSRWCFTVFAAISWRYYFLSLTFIRLCLRLFLNEDLQITTQPRWCSEVSTANFREWYGLSFTFHRCWQLYLNYDGKAALMSYRLPASSWKWYVLFFIHFLADAGSRWNKSCCYSVQREITVVLAAQWIPENRPCYRKKDRCCHPHLPPPGHKRERECVRARTRFALHIHSFIDEFVTKSRTYANFSPNISRWRCGFFRKTPKDAFWNSCRSQTSRSEFWA